MHINKVCEVRGKAFGWNWESREKLDGLKGLCYYNTVKFRGVAQFGSAPGLGPGGRRFKSSHLDHFMLREGL